MTAKTTTALILAAFTLVGLITTGVATVPSAFAQISGTETDTETTAQSGNQSETNAQSNNLDQDQTGAINEEIGSGEESTVTSDADSSADSDYKTKHKSNHDSGGYTSGTTTPGSSSATSSANSDVSNTGTLGQNQELNDPTQVNDNTFGNDESRAATVGFDLEFEQAVAVDDDNEVPPVDDGDGTDGDLVCFIPDGETEGSLVDLDLAAVLVVLGEGTIDETGDACEVGTV
jgi:hypothetical protein